MKFDDTCLSFDIHISYILIFTLYSPKSFSMLSKYINESLDCVWLKSEIVTGDVALVDMEWPVEIVKTVCDIAVA